VKAGSSSNGYNQQEDSSSFRSESLAKLYYVQALEANYYCGFVVENTTLQKFLHETPAVRIISPDIEHRSKALCISIFLIRLKRRVLATYIEQLCSTNAKRVLLRVEV
jgi:hypothetical protein